MKKAPLLSILRIAFIALGFALVSGLWAEVVFESNFESGLLGPEWTQAGDAGARAEIKSLLAGGLRSNWLVLDSQAGSVGNQNALGVVFELQGYDRIEVSFDLFTNGDADQPDSEGFDGLFIYVDGHLIHQSQPFQSYQTGANGVAKFETSTSLEGNVWDFRTDTVYEVTFLLARYGSQPWPTEGWAIDNFKVDAEVASGVYFEVPDSVGEGDGSFPVTVRKSPAPTDAESFEFFFDGEKVGGGLYPAGAEKAVFNLEVVDNEVLDEPSNRIYQVRRDGVLWGYDLGVMVVDDDVPEVAFVLADRILEGRTLFGTLKIVPPPAKIMSVQVGSVVHGKISSPAVWVQPGEMEVKFQITAQDDVAIEEEEIVALEAYFLDRTATTSIAIEDDDFYELSFGGSGGDLYKEGASTEARLYLRANALSDVRVLLSSMKSEFMEFPAEVVVPRGRNYSDPFTVRFPDDDKRTGLQLLELTARLPDFPEVEEATASFRVLDNEIEGFSIDVGPMLERGRDYDLTVTAINFEGDQERAFEAEITISLIKADGTESLLFGGPKMMTYGVMHLTLAATSELDGARIKVRGPFGVESVSSPVLKTYELLGWDFRDAMVDRETGNVLATFGADAPEDRRNSLVELSPASGQVLRRLQFPDASKPGRIGLSADRSIGYVGLDGNYSMSQIDMARFAQIQEFALVRSGRYAYENYGPGVFTAMDMVTFPGRPNDVLVSQDDAASSDTQTTFYRNGVPVLQESINSYAETFVPGLADDECFAISSSGSSDKLYRIRVSDAGYETLSSEESPFVGFRSKLERIGDIVYGGDGLIASINDFEELGRFERIDRNFSDFSMDTDKARSYFVSGNELLIYDLNTQRRIGRYAFPDVYFFSRVIVYGEGRLLLVARSRNFNEPGSVITFDTALLTPRGAPVDLELTALLESGDLLPGTPFLVEYEIKNLSSATASSVRAEIDLSDSVLLDGIEIMGAGEWFPSLDGSMQVELGDLVGEESRRFTLRLRVDGLADFDLDAFVLSDNPDTDFSNGAKLVSSSSVQRIGMDEWSFYDQDVETAIWEPVSKRLIAVNKEASGVWGNFQLLFFDPASGRLTGKVASDTSISQLHVTSDGRYLYGATSGYAVLKKLDLQTLEWLDDPLPDLWLNYSGGIRAMVVVDEQHEDFVLIGDQRIFRCREGKILPSDINITTNYSGSHVYLPDLKTVMYPFTSYGFDYVSLGQFKLTDSGVGHSKIDDVVFLEGESRIAEINGYLVGLKGTRKRLPEVGDLSALPFSSRVESELSYGDRFSDLLAVPESGRILFSDKRAIESYDAASGRLVRRVELSGLPSPIERMVRWGEDGLALILRDGGMSFARFDLLSGGAFPFDLLLEGGFGKRRLDDSGNLLLNGSIYAGDGISSVEVHGEPVDIAGPANEWSFALSDLAPGSHLVEVRARGRDGVEVTRTVEVYVPSALDADEDGLLDSWELARMPGAALSDLDGGSDSDGDGLSVWYEFLLGGDPLDFDRPYVLSIGQDAQGQWFLRGELLWRVEEGYRFGVEYQLLEAAEPHPLMLQATAGDAPEGYERATFRIPLESGDNPLLKLKIKAFHPVK